MILLVWSHDCRKVPPPRRLVAAATSRNAHSPAASSSDTPTASAEEGPRTPPSTPQPNTDSNVIDEANELEKQRKLEASEKIRYAHGSPIYFSIFGTGLQFRTESYQDITYRLGNSAVLFVKFGDVPTPWSNSCY